MEWTVVEVLVALVGLFFLVAKPMSEWASQLAENTQSMKDLRGEFANWDSRNEDSHKELKTEMEKNKAATDNTIQEHRRDIDACRHDLENHEARLQLIERNK